MAHSWLYYFITQQTEVETLSYHNYIHTYNIYEYAYLHIITYTKIYAYIDKSS